METRLHNIISITRCGRILVYSAGVSEIAASCIRDCCNEKVINKDSDISGSSIIAVVPEKTDIEYPVNGVLYECLKSLPKWRQQRIISYRNEEDQMRSLACSLLLAEGCRKLGWDSDGMIGKNGQPMLTEEGHYISLAHAGDCAVAAFSDEPVGVDVEEIGRFTKERRDKIRKKILTDAEDAYIRKPSSERKYDNDMMFLSCVWTRKEAYVKRNGRGLSMDFRNIETLGSNGYYTFCPEPGYMVSVCG